NTFPEIDGLDSKEDPALWGELQHQWVSKKVRMSAATGNWGACQVIRRRVPSARWSSTSVAGVGIVHGGDGVTSTKPSAVREVSGMGPAQRPAQWCCSVALFTPKRLATRTKGNLVVKATACCHRREG